MLRMNFIAAVAALLVSSLFFAAAAAQDLDKLSQARLAAIDGDHGTCARLSDEARRMPDSSWHAHHVFATCEVYDADTKRAEIGEEAYIARIKHAISALEFLLFNPGLLTGQSQRESVEFIVEELNKRVVAAQNALRE
jgi:hypothetical protein